MLRAEIMDLATALLRREVHAVLAARRIVALLSRLELEIYEDPIFLPLRGFESETDDYVAESIRAGFSEEYVRRVNRRVEEYVENTRASLEETCRDVVARLSTGYAPDSTPAIIEAPDRVPTYCVFGWKVRPEDLREQLGNDVYVACFLSRKQNVEIGRLDSMAKYIATLRPDFVATLGMDAEGLHDHIDRKLLQEGVWAQTTFAAKAAISEAIFEMFVVFAVPPERAEFADRYSARLVIVDEEFEDRRSLLHALHFPERAIAEAVASGESDAG